MLSKSRLNTIAVSTQNNWCKNVYPLAKFVTTVGDKALTVLQKIEEKQGRLVATFPKCLEPMAVPEDMHNLADQILASEQRPSVPLFQARAKHIIRERWWDWVLMHPSLQPDYVHPTRGV